MSVAFITVVTLTIAGFCCRYVSKGIQQADKQGGRGEEDREAGERQGDVGVSVTRGEHGPGVTSQPRHRVPACVFVN